MPKKSRKKKFVSDEYLNCKLREGDLPAWAELHERNHIAQFIRGVSKKRELVAESHGVELLFRKELEYRETVSKGTIIQLYVRVHDGMTKGDYLASWPIVAEYVRQLKQLQGGWSEDHSSRFFEVIEAKRVESKGKLGYGKLAEWINRRIERQLRAKKRNEIVLATVQYRNGKDKEWLKELVRRGYDTSVDSEDAGSLLRYFDFSEEFINEVVSSAENSIQEEKPLSFAIGRHAYTGPVTAAQVRAKLLKLRRHLSK